MRIVLDLQGAQNDCRSPRGIGRYSLALARAIAREPREHEVWLALSGRFPDSIEQLRANFANLVPPEHIRVFELPGPVAEADLGNSWRAQAAELLRERFLADLTPDIVHVSTMFDGIGNEAVVSAGRFDPTVLTSATLYDLIPLLLPETYLQGTAAERGYLRHAQSLKRTDLILAISESSRREAIELLQVQPERITVIGAGLAQSFQGEIELTRQTKEELTTRHALRRPFALYVGAFDPHKNVERLMAAFALLPPDLRAAHQLALIGKQHEESRNRLNETASAHGLNPSEVIFLGYVPDEDLRLLYAACTVFVFPSLHEGFGLPVLEAMACGAPVIGSNRTSIPEIINRPEALFDPENPKDIARAMAQVLSDSDFRQSLISWGRERAKIFTWEASAHKALDAFEALHAKRNSSHGDLSPPLPQYRPTLAFVAPLPPAPTETANYAARLLPNLARYYDVICVVDQLEVIDSWVSAVFPVRDVAWFESNLGRFDRILYHFGNSSAHKHIFDLLEQHPGVVVLHDFHLGDTLDWMAKSGYKPDGFTKALYDSHGFTALKKDHENGRERTIATFPCNGPVLRDSLGVIVHSTDVHELTRTWYGDKAVTVLREIPLPPDVNHVCDVSQANYLERIAELYGGAIEKFYTMSPAQEPKLLQAIGRISAPVVPSTPDLMTVATAIAANRERFGLSQILIDVSMLARSDARSGIQRVTRAIMMALLNDPPPGYRIEPVRAVADGYVYARRFACRHLALSEDCLSDEAVEAGRDDIFIGLDLAIDFVPACEAWFLSQRRRGMQVVFVVYDLLPLLQPHFFPTDLPPVVLRWINTVAGIADGMVCISRSVADELYGWLSQVKPRRLMPLLLGFFHLGADLRASLPTTGRSEDSGDILEKLRSRPSLLMVGTLEPRKGHRQALTAVERLWSKGVDVNLVMVGKRGWRIEELAQRIEGHPENGSRLFWLDGISDEMLEEVYLSSDALLAASEGEGFGLPLVEAAQQGLPVIARDIPVFREVLGEHAFFFRGAEAYHLADAIQVWLSLGNAAPRPSGLPWLTWQQSSRQLLDVVLSRKWYRSWPDLASGCRSAAVDVRSAPSE
jgi:glycosyltransferase involved in cell wall biosynthesis